jgi:hypothetical protein
MSQGAPAQSSQVIRALVCFVHMCGFARLLQQIHNRPRQSVTADATPAGKSIHETNAQCHVVPHSINTTSYLLTRRASHTLTHTLLMRLPRHPPSAHILQCSCASQMCAGSPHVPIKTTLFHSFRRLHLLTNVAPIGHGPGLVSSRVSELSGSTQNRISPHIIGPTGDCRLIEG